MTGKSYHFRILFLEDDRVSATVTTDKLMSLPPGVGLSFAITHVACLRDALDQLAHEQFDAVLSDLSLPDSRGVKTIVRLKDAAPNTAVVALTAETSVSSVLDCFEVGADDYIVKGETSTAALARAVLQAVERQDFRNLLNQSKATAHSSQAHAYAIVNAVAEGVITVDEHQQILTFNRAAEQLFGYRAAEVIGSDVSIFIPAERRETYRRQIVAYLAAQHDGLELFEREEELLHKQGQRIPANVSLSQVRDHQQERQFCVVVRDLTEPKAREASILALSDNLKDQNEKLAAAYEQARAATKAKSEFLANMSHELRTPLTAILGFSETLLADDVLKHSPEHLESVRIILRNGEHLIGLINDILDLSKIEAGSLEIHRDRCSPMEITQEVIHLMQVRADAKGIPLVMRCETEIPDAVLTDGTRLKQVLINLVGNAIKFTEVGRVQVVASAQRTENDQYELRWDVIDTGIGMTDGERQKLFQPFSQANATTTRRFGGTGLGLAICKRLLGLLGGQVDVTSEVGKGSCFHIRLPVKVLAADGPSAGASAQAAGRASSSPPPAAQAVPQNFACRVLYAEDGPDNQRLVSFVLRKKGADVTVVDNGLEAVQKAMEATLTAAPFDIVLMDMQMPVMDGYEAVRKLRESGFRTPIVALTAHAMKGDRDKCIAAGCDDYVTKPIDRDKLFGVIVRHTSRSLPAAAEKLELARG